MIAAEIFTSRVSMFGRLADDLSRRSLGGKDFEVELAGDRRGPVYKDDGHFVFVDLEPSATPYRLNLQARSYQNRVLQQALPAGPPLELAFDGEDELYVAVTGIAAARNEVSFAPVSFVPTIAAGASVLVEGGIATTLAEPLEGRDVGFAVLADVSGITVGAVLRLVRSSRLIMRPGPYHAFAHDATVVAINVTLPGANGDPVEAATITIIAVNGAAPATVTVGGLTLRRVDLAGPPASTLLFGPAEVATSTNARGDAVFYFPPTTPITGLDVAVTKPQHAPTSATLAVVAQTRQFQALTLAPL